MKRTLALFCCLFLCGAGAGAASGAQKELDSVAALLGAEVHYAGAGEAARAKLKERFGVDDAVLDGLKAKGLGYGEIAAALALARGLPGGMTVQNAERLYAERAGRPNKKWSEVAEKFGIDQGPALASLKQIQLELRGTAAGGRLGSAKELGSAGQQASGAAQPAGAAVQLPAGGATAGAGGPGSGAFEEGLRLMRAGDYAGARKQFLAASAADPDADGPLYNAGAAAYGAGDYPGAAASWEKLAARRPADWRVRESLVQAWQAAGDSAKRDAARQALRGMKRAGRDRELAAAEFFCRERFTEGNRTVMALEYFELTPPKGKIYSFVVSAPGGAAPDYVVSLGSYESTTQVARQMKEIGPEERLFHLDAYLADNSHETLGMFKKRPGYEEVRNMVTSYMRGGLKALTSLKRGGPAK